MDQDEFKLHQLVQSLVFTMMRPYQDRGRQACPEKGLGLVRTRSDAPPPPHHQQTQASCPQALQISFKTDWISANSDFTLASLSGTGTADLISGTGTGKSDF